MENDVDDIHELTADDEVQTPQKKRSGMVVKTSIFDDSLDEDEELEEEPGEGFEAEKQKLLLLQKKVAEAYENLSSRQEEIEALKEEMEQKEKALDEREATIKEMERELEEKQSENERLSDKLQDEEETHTQLTGELELRETELEEKAKELKDKTQELVEKKHQVEELQRAIAEKERCVEEKEQFLHFTEKELEERDAQIEESKSFLKAELDRIRAEKNGIENENRRLKKEKSELQLERKEHQREKKMFLHKIGVLKKKEAKLVEKETEVEKTLQKMRRGEDRESKLLEEIEEKEGKLRQESGRVERLKSELESERTTLKHAQQELERAQQRLKEEEAALKTRSSRMEEEFHQRFLQMEKEASLAPPVGEGETAFDEEFSELFEELKGEQDESHGAEERIELGEELAKAEAPSVGLSAPPMDGIDEIADFLRSEKEEEGELATEIDVEELDEPELEPELPTRAEIPPAEAREADELSMSGKDINDKFSSAEMSSEIMGTQNLSPEEQAKKIQQYRSIIGHFKEKGYNVINVVRALERNDFNLIRERMLDFMEKVQKLKELEKELNTISSEGLEDTVYVIRSKLKDPQAVPKIEKTMESIRKQAEEKERKKREAKMKELKKVQELFQSLEKKYKLDDYVDEIYDVRTKMDNPDLLDMTDLAKLSAHIKKLETSIAEREHKKKAARLEETIRLEIQEFKKRGYRVKPLEEALAKDIRSAEKLYLDFLSNIDRLEELKSELEGMKTLGFEKEKRAIEEQMNNPTKLDIVEDAINSLKRKIRVERIKAMDLTLHEKRRGKPAGKSLNLGDEGVATKEEEPAVIVESPLDKPLPISKPEPKPEPQADSFEKPKVKVCPSCKSGRIVIPPKTRPIRVNCQNCGKEYLITGDAGAARPTPKKKASPFDGQEYTEEKTSETTAPPNIASLAAPPAVNEGKCPNCGAELIVGSDFCGFCGHRIG